MTWRRIPPVSSPVSLTALVAGAGAAAGIVQADVAQVEALLARAFAPRATLLTDSGTSALVLALRIAAAPKATVAMPAYVCIDLIAAAQRAGVAVRLFDLDPRTMSPDLDSLRAACTRGVSAVVVAPLYGYPADLPGVTRVAAEFGVPVIEDAAQSAGSTVDNRRVGTFGAVSILSFGRGKGTTGGSGGALMIHDAGLVERAAGHARTMLPASRGARDVVALGAQWLLGRPSLYAIPSSIPALKLGEMIYHPAGEPRRLGAAPARIVRWALEGDAAEVRARQLAAAKLEEAARRGARLRPVETIGTGVPGYLRLAAKDRRGRPVPPLGVLRGYPVTLDQHPQTRSVLAAGESAGPGAQELRDTLFTLPTHSRMSGGDLDRLVEWLETPEGADTRGSGANSSP